MSADSHADRFVLRHWRLSPPLETFEKGTSAQAVWGVRDAVVHCRRGTAPGLNTLDDVVALAAYEHHLAVVSTLRADGTIQSPCKRRVPRSSVYRAAGTCLRHLRLSTADKGDGWVHLVPRSDA
jgi:hypothetical protein